MLFWRNYVNIWCYFHLAIVWFRTKCMLFRISQFNPFLTGGTLQSRHIKILWALLNWLIAPELNDVLQDALKVINLIKNHALNSRLFSNLCKDTNSNYTTWLLHVEVRWLSRGQSLKRLLLLKDEIEIFLTELKCEFAAFFKMTCGYPSCVFCQIFLRS